MTPDSASLMGSLTKAARAQLEDEQRRYMRERFGRVVHGHGPIDDAPATASKSDQSQDSGSKQR